jgi:hypothetical protein
MTFLIMKLCPFSCFLLFVNPNILYSILFPNTCNLSSSLHVGDQILYPYKMTGNIIINFHLHGLYTSGLPRFINTVYFIFIFLNKTKIF